MHISSRKEGTHCAMNQTNTKAICYSATNSNYNFYVSLVNPFVVLQSHGYGKQLNLHVKEVHVDEGKDFNPHFSHILAQSAFICWSYFTSFIVMQMWYCF